MELACEQGSSALGIVSSESWETFQDSFLYVQ